MSLIYKIPLKLIFIACFLFCLSCENDSKVSQTQEYSIQEFNKVMSDGGNAVATKDFEQAENKYSTAIIIATKINYQDGIVMAKDDLGSVYVMRKKYDTAEITLNEVRDTCKLRECPEFMLNSNYDNLIHLYIYKLRNVEKTKMLINEIVERKDKFQNDKIADKISRYQDSLVEAGFYNESKEIKTLLK